MSDNRSDSDTGCDSNPLQDVEDASNLKFSEDEAKQRVVKRRPRASSYELGKLWDIFEKIPEERGIASCRLCHRKLSYRTTSNNLRKHLHHIHPFEVDADLLPSSVSSKPKNSEKSEKAIIRINSEKSEKPIIKAEEKDSDSESPRSPPAGRPYRSSSIAWKYFSIVCRRRRRARCKLCSKMYSYATTVTNLLTHLERRHNNVHLEESGEIQATPTSPLWAYFKCLDEAMQLACCRLCKKRIDYSDDCHELRRHLARKHPNVDLEEGAVSKTFMVTDDGDLYEIDVNKPEPAAAECDNDENEAYVADYLDETAYDEPEERKVKSKQNTPKIRLFSKKIQQSGVLEQSTSKPNEEITKNVKEDSLDIFGRYIVSLLKTMPKNVSDKLQYQIVKQIFDVQSEEATTVKDNNVTSNSEQSPVIILQDK